MFKPKLSNVFIISYTRHFPVEYEMYVCIVVVILTTVVDNIVIVTAFLQRCMYALL